MSEGLSSINDLKNNLAATTKSIKERIIESGVWEHITELRKRLFYALISLIAATVFSFLFADKFVQFLAIPVGGIQALQAIEVTESIEVFMRVALLSGLVIASPFMIYQLLAFIMPGLTDSEKRWVYIAIPCTTFMMLLGMAFTYYVMMPTALPVLLSFMNVRTVPRLDNYISFTTNLIFWVGVSFESPFVIFILAKLKLISAKMLMKGWRIAVLVCALLAAFITPTGDPVNMMLLMTPLLALYSLGILMAVVARRNDKPKEDKLSNNIN